MLNVETVRKISPTSMESIHPSLRRKSSTIKPVKEEVLYLSKSLQLTEYTFEDENGKAKSAEVIHKRYMVGVNNNNNDIQEDTILSIAILKRHCLCDCLILVRRYRPTLKSYALEFPARIIEQRYSDKSGDEAAKEIEENTGYGSTKVKYISPQTATDPELCDSKVKLVSMIIDGDDPIKNNFFHAKNPQNNSDQQQQQEQQEQQQNGHHNDDDNDIEIILLPINGLLDRLNEYYNNGTIVDSRVYAFAIGLKKGEKLSENVAQPENIEIAI
ncbi:ADP-sugar pyrophosphatase-like [Dermatophagoides pteronyssinus]|uniref:ADP-sugar pyrophosphatase-like n=1 Tax=Dermatophagoides pteronyssinus TaxID=6956 RepID=A0A6P6XPX6_DERPT|nr:ADP-sugar pyrophosphatase-like [Dermatophagoides pteronyssinus]